MFASYKKNALIGQVLSGDAGTEGGGEKEVHHEGGHPRHSGQSFGGDGKRRERTGE